MVNFRFEAQSGWLERVIIRESEKELKDSALEDMLACDLYWEGEVKIGGPRMASL